MTLQNSHRNSHLPKYRQLILRFEEAIKMGALKQGDQLPSLNSVKLRYKVSRDTALLAFTDLKQRGIIDSVAGKGYFVKNADVNTRLKVFLLFDELNAFKEDLYKGFLEGLDAHDKVDIFFHHFNREVFKSLLIEKQGNYNYYVIMPANMENIRGVIEELPKNQVYVLDQTSDELKDYPGIYQNFRSNICDGLLQLKDEVLRYQELVLIFDENKQPEDLKLGVQDFCRAYNIKLRVQSKVQRELSAGQLYLVLDDRDLIELLKYLKATKLALAEHLGIIGYNETMLKEIVEGGITSISTNFKQMGQHLAQLIIAGEELLIDNSFEVIKRASL